jgi:hypothetical protein
MSELKSVDNMRGSINELISQSRQLRRPPSLSDSFAWTPENIARANLIPLISSSDRLEILAEENIQKDVPPSSIEERISERSSCEKYAVETLIKLLLHITLISIFETLFYFLYVSTLEDSGIVKTVDTFINGAANNCENMTPLQIQLIDDFLEPYINASQVIAQGNAEEVKRNVLNKAISNQAWAYVGGMMGIFVIAVGYIKARKIEIRWRQVILENVAMVSLLALYELMFFNTIIYPYQPVSTEEISRNAVLKLQSQCGILE